jgi:hypothetical protein
VEATAKMFVWNGNFCETFFYLTFKAEIGSDVEIVAACGSFNALINSKFLSIFSSATIARRKKQKTEGLVLGQGAPGCPHAHRVHVHLPFEQVPACANEPNNK